MARIRKSKEADGVVIVPILAKDVAALSELDIDELEEVKKIRHFVDQKLDEIVKKSSDSAGRGISDIEELAMIFLDAHSRYTQVAKITPELYANFAEKANELDSLYGSYQAKAKKALGEFELARTSYENAVKRMKNAYKNLNNSDYAFAFDESIMTYTPNIERNYLSGVRSDYWRGGNDD